MINIFPLYSAYPWLAPVNSRQLRQIVLKLSGYLEASTRQPRLIDLYLVNDSYIASANKEYLGCCGPTNILSFPGDDMLPGTLLLSLDTFSRECKLFGQTPIDHLVFLLCHGLLHLAGLDHGSEMDNLQDLCIDFFHKQTTL